MNLMDTLTPQTVTIIGARKVLNMTKKDDAEDLRLSQETQDAMDLNQFLKKRTEEELKASRRTREMKRRRIARLRDAVKRARGKLEIAERNLKEALCETLG